LENVQYLHFKNNFAIPWFFDLLINLVRLNSNKKNCEQQHYRNIHLSFLIGELMDITIFIAIYAALLSTVLGIRELLKEKRKLIIIIEDYPFYEKGYLILFNIGNPKIIISDVSFSVAGEPAPANVIFDISSSDLPFPCSIQSGDFIKLPLSGVIFSALRENKNDVKIGVFDIEGNIYDKFVVNSHNPKWGYVAKIE
jgi:hypothetical protein